MLTTPIPMPGLYAIVDVPHPHGLGALEVATAVVGNRLEGGDCGADMVQLRAKSATTAQRRELVASMAEVCGRAGAKLWVNDDPGAVVDGVAGVHLGQGDPGADDVQGVRARSPEAPGVGLSTHDTAQLKTAIRQRPDYVAFGPVLPTQSKANPDPVVGFAGLIDACRMSSAPLVAIGGLGLETGVRAIEVGATWVATISALAAPTLPEVRARAEALAEAFRAAAQPWPLDRVAEAIPVLPPEQLQEIAAWADSLGIHVELGLPARFRPWVDDNGAWYRPSDVVDLQYALGKQPDETWDNWRDRAQSGEIGGQLVQLRLK